MSDNKEENIAFFSLNKADYQIVLLTLHPNKKKQ